MAGGAPIDMENAERTYRAIGRFVYEFSQTEYMIRYYLAQELNIRDEFFAPVIQSYDVGLLCNVTKQVMKKARTAEQASAIEELLNRFMKLNEERVRVVHGLWVPFSRGGLVSHVSRTNLQPKMHDEQADALEKSADDLREIRSALTSAFTGVNVGH